jgi:elongation factor P
MVQATQLRVGMVVIFKEELHSVFKTEHRTPGKGRGFVQAKLRNLRTGSIFDHKFASTDFVDRAFLEERDMEYLYEESGSYYFMNTETYEQIELPKDVLGDAMNYLVANTSVGVEFYEGTPVNVKMPASVNLEVVETEPGLKSATVSNVSKPAKMESGLVVQVPPFIDVGEKIKVSTTDGTYQERASSK